jgi:hypothetical protein
MPFPTIAVNTTNADAGTDVPATFRGDVLDAINKLNQILLMISYREEALSVTGTMDIGGYDTQRVAFSGGSGAITSLGSNYSGPILVRVLVSCSLTYNSTTLITPGAVNMTLRSGDWFMAVPKGNGFINNGWQIIPAPWTGLLALNGATPAATAGLTVGRTDSSNEGGEIVLCRASDNAAKWAMDVYYDGASQGYRIYDVTAARVAIQINDSGYVGINHPGTITAPLDIVGNHIRIQTARTPASAGAAGNAGDICWDSSYIYCCTASNTWKRVAISTW